MSGNLSSEPKSHTLQKVFILGYSVCTQLLEIATGRNIFQKLLKWTADRHKQTVSEGKLRANSVAPKKNSKQRKTQNDYFIAISRLIIYKISTQASVVKTDMDQQW